MKKSAKQSLRAKTTDELGVESSALRMDMLKARLSTTLEGKRLSMRNRSQRRQIARIATILTEREIANKSKAN